MQGHVIGTVIAHDIDDETTPNAQVGYAIRSIEPGPDTEARADADNLFEIDEVSGVVRYKINPKGYWGTWLVTFEAFDHGHLWTSNIQLNSTKMFELTIEPYNFNAPTIINPINGRTYRLRLVQYELFGL